MNIEPLDIIFFQGSVFVSDIIMFAEDITFGNGEWSHVGIVVNTDIIPIHNGKPNTLYILESTKSDNQDPNIETDKPFYGVQFRELHSVVDDYIKAGGKVGIGKLIQNPYLQHDKLDFIKEKFEYVRTHLIGKTYDFIDLFVPALPQRFMQFICPWFFKKDNEKCIFCSELVFRILQLLDLYPADDNAKFFAPVELIGYTNDHIPLIIHLPIVLIIK